MLEVIIDNSYNDSEKVERFLKSLINSNEYKVILDEDIIPGGNIDLKIRKVYLKSNLR